MNIHVTCPACTRTVTFAEPLEPGETRFCACGLVVECVLDPKVRFVADGADCEAQLEDADGKGVDKTTQKAPWSKF